MVFGRRQSIPRAVTMLSKPVEKQTTVVNFLFRVACQVNDSTNMSRGTTTPVCQSRGTAPDVHAILQSCVSQHNPATSRASRDSRLILSTPGALPPRNFLTTSAASSPEFGEPNPESPGSASSMKGMLVRLRRSSKYSAHQPTTSRVEVSSTTSPVLVLHCFPLLSRQMVEQNRLEVFFYGLSKLLPRPSFCLSNHPSHMPLRLPVPISCFWSLTGQKDPIGLLLQPDSVPLQRCPPTGSRVAATTGTDNLAAAAPISCLCNGGTEHGPLKLNVPRLPQVMFEVLPEMGVPLSE
ncbi:uncharacterized protein LOC107834147 [Poecilia formosa]|uniref:uncharacterized protein LOC107834147 n=1 Tax=Poecilia formosa TaxID=48698 RepID=UPI0007B993EE|nr:PREDICTED: uncharacterized protein LOC107834147 [Poecilia formosa]